MMNHKRTGYILITLLYMMIISYLSLRPVSQGYHGSIAQQAVFNFLHIPAYGLLFYLILRSFSSAGVGAYLFSFTIAVLFGVINEYLQSFVPGRYASVTDALLNGAGSGAALLICLRIKNSKIKYTIRNLSSEALAKEDTKYSIR